MIIESLTNYTYLLIITVFITNIIQMVSPDGKMKKYILFISSLIVTIILLEPILKFINKDLNMENIFSTNLEEYKLSFEENETNLDSEILSTYKENIKTDIIKRLEDLDYTVHSVSCEYDELTLEPKYIRLEISSYDGEIRPVKIEISNINSNEITQIEKWKIETLLKDTYGFKEVEISSWKSY